MGCRNPYRISIDSKTGYLYWGDVGPDGRIDSTLGPRGYDEINQARKPGFFGWPYFIGNNYAYADINRGTPAYMTRFDPANPVNDTRHNRGVQELPPAQPAFIWYPYVESADFPLLGNGGRNAMAGPVYYRDEFEGTSSQFPAYYNGKLFFYDFMRDWIMLATMDESGDLETIEPFLPKGQMRLSSPMDMQFGPDGALYVLNYGTKWFTSNQDAQIIRIDYSEANRPPSAVATVDHPVGASPHTVTLSGSETWDQDPDDQLSYLWKFPDGSTTEGETVSYTFNTNGSYEVELQVSDIAGNTSSAEVTIQVGNAPPQIAFEIEGNQDFFWREVPIRYQVLVEDREDGSLASGSISEEAVAISWAWDANGLDPTQGAQGHQALMEATMEDPALRLINGNGCLACHAMDKKVIGPSYAMVHEKYKDQADAVAYLANKIKNGGSGVWGGQAMPAMEQLSEGDARRIASYLVSLGEEAGSGLAPAGKLMPDQHEWMVEEGRIPLGLVTTIKAEEE